jgi:chromate transport protein ChrA
MRGKWISMQRFTRVYAAYQVLPGPEATELAVYFGILAGGKLGGLMGGIGFITPGILLMLLSSWFYTRYGIQNAVFASVFHGLQPAVCAMVFRAAHKIGESTCRHHSSGIIDWRLALVTILAALESVLSVNFFITKVHLVLLYLLLRKRWYVASVIWAAAPIVAFIAVIAVLGPMGQLVPQVCPFPVVFTDSHAIFPIPRPCK